MGIVFKKTREIPKSFKINKKTIKILRKKNAKWNFTVIF